MSQKEKIEFDRVSVINRWRMKKYSRNGDWVVFGLSKWWASFENYCWKISLFGVDVQIWFKRRFI